MTCLPAFLLYAAPAAGVFLVLPAVVAGVEAFAALLVAVLSFVLLAVTHEVVVRWFADERYAERLRGLQVDLTRLWRDYESLVAEVGQLRTTLGRSASKNDDLLSEMRMMRGLLAKLDPAKRSPTAAESESATTVAELREPTPRGGERTDLSRSQILEVTRQALTNNRDDLYLQPVVQLPDRRVRFYEAFSRLRDDQGNLILPEQCIPVVVRAGPITTIDNLLLFRCVQMIKRAQRDRVSVGFFCNVAVESLVDREFFDQFVEYMELRRDLASTLVFKLSQDEAERESVAPALTALHRLGFGFSVDRVTDLSVDLRALAKKGIRYAKVEGERLLGDLTQSGSTFRLPDLAEAMRRSGITLIADRIETDEAAERLERHGIALAQGYLFGEPGLARDGR